MKHQLSFILRVLFMMEAYDKEISKEILSIIEIKDSLQKKVSDKIIELNKEPTNLYDELDVRETFNNFFDLADEELKEIKLFTILQEFYNKVSNGEEYEIEGWEGSTGSGYIIPDMAKYSYKEK